MSKRKHLILSLSIIIIFSLSINSTALAASAVNSEKVFNTITSRLSTVNKDIEIKRALEDISDVEITKDLYDQLGAYSEESNGDRENLKVHATIRDLGSIAYNGKTGILYTMTMVTNGTQKTDNSNTSLKDVLAYGSVTWIDYLGTNNELVSVSG
ncbi:MAG: hypothetical protein WCD89_06060 [Anaerocolumna sp.]